MTFRIPSLPELVERSRRAFRTHLPGSDAWLWPNNINPTAKVVGGMIHEVFGYADYVQRQKFALTAEGENLDLHGEELGLARRAADVARGTVRLVATGPLTVEAGATLRRLDGTVVQTLQGGSLLAAGTLTLPAATVAAGRSSNTLAGTSLEPVSGISGSVTAEVDAGGLSGGMDVELDGEPFTSDLATFRGRILFRKRNPPNGGSAADYVMWASEIPGVTRVFVERTWSGPGSVRVFPLFDGLYPDGIAPAAVIDLVRETIDMHAPAGAIVTVAAPGRHPVDITVRGLVPADTATRNAAVEELRAMFVRKGRVAGANNPHPSMPYLATPLVFSRSWAWQAVANAASEEAHEISAPVADTAIVAGTIPVLNSVQFISS